jgi:hypothetical protein
MWCVLYDAVVSFSMSIRSVHIQVYYERMRSDVLASSPKELAQTHSLS